MTNKTSIGPAIASLATIVAVAGGGAYLLANPTSGSKTTTPSQEVVVNRVNRLSSGEATYYSATTGKTDEIGFRFVDRTSLDMEHIDPYFEITYSDGIKASYRFANQKDVVIYSTGAGGAPDATRATYRVDGRNVVITSESGSVTTLGGFATTLERVQDKATNINESREREQRQEQQRLNDETFDQMVSRISKQACVKAEGLSYISTNTVVQNAINPVIRSIKMSEANQRRWNNMNPRLRTQHVTGAMMFDCNNVMQVVVESDLNSALLGISMMNF